MARRGGRRGRRSRSKQRSRGAGSRSSKAKSSKSRSRNTRGSGARKSAPSKRRSAPKASNRRATASKARRAAPKKSAPKKKAPTRRAPTKKNVRGSGVSPQKKQAAKTVKKVVSAATKPQAAAAKSMSISERRSAAMKKKVADSLAAKKSIQEKAAERHAQFKKTGVQTYGGTRNVNSYTKKELDKLQSYARTTGKSFGMTIGQPGVKYPGKTGMEKLPEGQVPNADGLVMNSVGQYVTPAQLAKDDADAGPSIGRSIAKGINTIKNNVIPFGRRIPDLKTDYTVAQEARLKATTPYKTGQRTKTGAIAGRGSSDNRMQIQQPTAPTRESVEQLAAMSDALPPDSIRETPAPQETPPTPNTLIQPERFIDVGGGKQVSASGMADYLASLRDTWDQQSQAYQSQIGQLQGQIGGFETQVGGLQGQIGGYQSQIGQLEGQVGDYQSQIGGYQGQVSDFERTIADYRRQVGGYETQLGDYRGQVSGLQRDITDYQGQIGGLRGDISDYRMQIGGLQKDIGGYKGQIGELQGDIGRYQGEIGGLRGDIKGLKGDIEGYQSRERQAREMQIRQMQRQRVAQSYGGKKKARVGGVKTGRIEEEARMFGPRATFNRSGLRISSLNIQNNDSEIQV